MSPLIGGQGLPVEVVIPGEKTRGLFTRAAATGDLFKGGIGRWNYLYEGFGFPGTVSQGVQPIPNGWFTITSLGGTTQAIDNLGQFGLYSNYRSSNSINTQFGWRPSVIQGLPITSTTPLNMLFYVKTGSLITTVRLFVGFWSNGNFANNADNPTTPGASGAFFRFSTAAPDSSWVGCATDGATNTFTTVNVGPAVAALTEYILRIRVTTTQVQFFVNEQFSGTLNRTAQPLGASPTVSYNESFGGFTLVADFRSFLVSSGAIWIG